MYEFTHSSNIGHHKYSLHLMYNDLLTHTSNLVYDSYIMQKRKDKIMKLGHNRKFFTIVFIFLLTMISIALFNRLTKESISDSAAFIAAVIGVVAIWYQMKKDADISKAEFILTLNCNFQDNDNISYIYTTLKEKRDGKDVSFSEDDGRKMGEYIMFFQTMYFMIDEGVIDIRMIDRLFANKFFLFMHNPDVQKYQLIYTTINKPILELYCIWYNYRIKNDLPILYPEYMPHKTMDKHFTEVNKKIKLNDAMIVTY